MRALQLAAFAPATALRPGDIPDPKPDAVTATVKVATGGIRLSDGKNVVGRMARHGPSLCDSQPRCIVDGRPDLAVARADRCFGGASVPDHAAADPVLAVRGGLHLPAEPGVPPRLLGSPQVHPLEQGGRLVCHLRWRSA